LAISREEPGKLSEFGDNQPAKEPANLQDLRVRRDSPVADSRDAFLELKNQLKTEIIAQASPAVDLSDRNQARPFVHDCLDDLLEKKGIVLNRNEKRQLLDAIVADLIVPRS
jgi:hypothetical protein